MWVARDLTGAVRIFSDKPEKYIPDHSPWTGWWISESNFSFYEKSDNFPEVTWENSPVEIKTTLSNENIDSAKESILNGVMSYIDHMIMDTESGNAYDNINKELYPSNDYKQGKLDTLKNLKDCLNGRFDYEV